MVCKAKTPQKNKKTQEKMSFFPRGSRVFLPKRVIFGPFLRWWVFGALQVAVHEQLESIEKTAVFQKSRPKSVNFGQPYCAFPQNGQATVCTLLAGTPCTPVTP
jgi:hypothetical protein